ncbi:MAG: carboxylesterase family protein, partial [Clostridia bacterium]|nr:carboxylesterase family protein [Clostridia bacterium]
MKHRFILTLLAVALSLAMIGCNTHVIAARAEGFNELKPPEEVKAELNAGYGENKPITDDNYDRALAVKCNNGTFVGKETDELIIWKGIPYATQPLGKLRWQKALPASDDDGVYDATEPGHIPIGPVNDSEGTAEFGEDCLVLNIYCNTSCTDSKKPVMVWIHGGGFCAESQA